MEKQMTPEDKYKIVVQALRDILDEDIIDGNGKVMSYNNPLTSSLRNIALEALEEVGFSLHV